MLTVKVVVPPAITIAFGTLVIVNSAALVPKNVIAPIVKSAVPRFWIVKVLVVAVPILDDPKSDQSVIDGVISPSKIVMAFPCIFISGKIPLPWIVKS